MPEIKEVLTHPAILVAFISWFVYCLLYIIRWIRDEQQVLYWRREKLKAENDKKAQEYAALKEEEAKKKKAEDFENFKTMMKMVQSEINGENPSGLPS